MGISLSCPFDGDVEKAFDSIIVKCISFGADEVKTPVRAVNFGTRDLEPTVMKSLGSGKMRVERSVSFKDSELEKMISVKAPSLEKENNAFASKKMDSESKNSDSSVAVMQRLPILDPSNPKHQAAIKLQKVYKSFRTRRKLADCAVLVEQSWWKLLDFAELKHSSVSFFDIEKHETAISRWSRARTRAAKVGKGLSKNDKAQKLTLQHWLEAIDPRHRYGHNLHFYYIKWLHSKNREPFFYWLDIGEGKEINLEKCPRSKLQQQCIKYLGPMERKAYEVAVEDGKFIHKQTGELLYTTDDAKWIFVLSTSKTLYVGEKKKGTFQHSSFLAGGVTIAAGRLIVKNGILKAVWPHSGHYRPTEENFNDFLSFLRENDVDLTDVKTSPPDEDEISLYAQRTSKHIRNASEEDWSLALNNLDTEEINDQEKSSLHQLFAKQLTNLEIPRKDEVFEMVESENSTVAPTRNKVEDDCESTDDGSNKGSKNVYAVPKRNLFDEEGNDVENIPQEAILERIHSKKGTQSYQLGKQLSCGWTTGAGPRISCVRDYPSKLQFKALEQVNLSPRGTITHSLSTSSLMRLRRQPKVAYHFGGESTVRGVSLMLAEANGAVKRTSMTASCTLR